MAATRNFEAKITLSRNAQGDIKLSVGDAHASVPVLDVTMTEAEFAKMIFSEIQTNVRCVLHGTVKHVGKVRLVEVRSLKYPYYGQQTRHQLLDWVLQHHKDSEWTVDTNLSASNYINGQGTESTIHYRVFKYVTKAEEK